MCPQLGRPRLRRRGTGRGLDAKCVHNLGVPDDAVATELDAKCVHNLGVPDDAAATIEVLGIVGTDAAELQLRSLGIVGANAVELQLMA